MQPKSRRQIIEELQGDASTNSEENQNEENKLIETFEIYQDEELSSFVSDMRSIREMLDSSFKDMLNKVQIADECDEGGIDIDAMLAESRQRLGFPTRHQHGADLPGGRPLPKLSSTLPPPLAEILFRMNELLKSQLDKVVANEDNAPFEQQLDKLKQVVRTYLIELDKISI